MFKGIVPWQNTRVSSDTFHLAGGFEGDWRASGLDARRVFDDPRITIWRSIAERENGVLDFEPEPGRRTRWHIKRFRSPDRGAARREAAGIGYLVAAGISTVPLVAWGGLTDGRSFIISEDLRGYVPADRMGGPGPDLRGIAAVAARLHNFGLHHRDLYLCHFLVHETRADVRLIDAGRVKRLPGWPWTRRWIVKDLAQLHYSARILDEEDRRGLWTCYFAARGLAIDAAMMRAIERKSGWIARHDRRLKAKRPERDVTLPAVHESGGGGA